MGPFLRLAWSSLPGAQRDRLCPKHLGACLSVGLQCSSPASLLRNFWLQRGDAEDKSNTFPNTKEQPRES